MIVNSMVEMMIKENLMDMSVNRAFGLQKNKKNRILEHNLMM
jgi:hypothetical protein